MTGLSPGDVIGRAWATYRDQAGVLIPAALGIFALEAIAALVFNEDFTGLVGLISLVLSIFFQGMVVQLVRDVQDGRRDHSLGELLSSVTPVFWPLLAVSLLFGLGVAIGIVLLIVPGLILLTIWAVVAPVTVLERPGVFRAFGRSRDLVRGDGWPVFGVIVLVWLLTIAVSIVAWAIGAPLGAVGEVVVQWLAGAIIAPFAALASATLYFRLRELRGEAGAPAAEPAGPDETAPGVA